jgi:hypothetical protein
MILWDVNALRRDLQEIADEDPTIHANRRAFMTMENSYSGPYTGPETVRRFVVVAEGVRSSYCLCVRFRTLKIPLLTLIRPISSFNDRGCSQQQDQQSYGVIYTGNISQAANLPEERGMIQPPVYIASVAPKPWPREVLLKTDVPPAPLNSELPSLELPARCRLDYRRLCEVEHNVCSWHIGLVCSESLKVLEEYAASVGLASQSLGRVDDDVMDLS